MCVFACIPQPSAAIQQRIRLTSAFSMFSALVRESEGKNQLGRRKTTVIEHTGCSDTEDFDTEGFLKWWIMKIFGPRFSPPGIRNLGGFTCTYYAFLIKWMTSGPTHMLDIRWSSRGATTLMLDIRWSSRGATTLMLDIRWPSRGATTLMLDIR